MATAGRVLEGVAALYGAAIRLRNLYYDRVPPAARRVGAPVISVGNLSAGGTGKTPMVIALVERLSAMGRRPVVLTRGYGTPRGGVADEVAEIRLAAPGVPVVVNADRVAGARGALARGLGDCFVLDDGFQHRRLRRDLDVVLIDALDPWGGGALLPAGRLREPLEGLSRADVIVITRSNQVAPDRFAEIETRVRALAPGAATLSARVAPHAVVFAGGESAAPESLARRRAVLVCAIGNPDSFVRLTESIGIERSETLVFRDHHPYARNDADAVAAAAQRRGAGLILTTRKDWVKLAPLWDAVVGGPAASPRLARLDVRVELDAPDAARLEALLRACLARA